jgi:hypothetical protein
MYELESALSVEYITKSTLANDQEDISSATEEQ